MRVSITTLQEMKKRGEKICVLTAYDYPMARVLDDAGIPVLLVGDSLGMVVLGYESTIPVTMEDMLHHIKAVSRGAKKALVIGDLPFMSYHLTQEQGLANAARFIQEGGCQAVKLEGGTSVAPLVRRLVDCGIPVMGHLGLTPQSVHQFGGYKVQGKTTAAARKLLEDALALEDAGAFSVVLECIPAPLAALISKRVRIPTIGIGAGPDCDGQVQVITDILGYSPDYIPRHAKQYTDMAAAVKDTAQRYLEEVKAGAFPAAAHSYPMDERVLSELANL